MKQLFFTFLFITSAVCLRATVITVSNNSNSPGQYTDLQIAANAAADNDTLYIHGSATSYNVLFLEKPLTLIGTGALANNSVKLSTMLSGFYIRYNTANTNSASGSKIIGLNVSGQFSFNLVSAGLAGLNNILINRCKIDNLSFNDNSNDPNFTTNNITIMNSIIGVILPSQMAGNTGLKDIVLKNNIICGAITKIGTPVTGSWLITNNTFINTGSIGECSNAIIANNIFYYSGSAASIMLNNANSTITNNCFIATSGTVTSSDVLYGTNTGGNNLYHQDPLFQSYNTSSTSLLVYTQTNPGPFIELVLQPASPCKNYGTDGTDIGIYGGATPFSEGFPANSRYRYFPMSAIPHIINMNVLNGTVLPNGTLNVQFKARKQN